MLLLFVETLLLLVKFSHSTENVAFDEVGQLSFLILLIVIRGVLSTRPSAVGFVSILIYLFFVAR